MWGAGRDKWGDGKYLKNWWLGQGGEHNKIEYKETEKFWISSYKIRSRTTFLFINKHSVTNAKLGQ